MCVFSTDSLAGIYEFAPSPLPEERPTVRTKLASSLLKSLVQQWWQDYFLPFKCFLSVWKEEKSSIVGGGGHCSLQLTCVLLCTMIMGNFSSRHFVFLRLCKYSRRRLTGSPVIDEVATTWRKSLKSGPLGRRSSSRRTYFRLSSEFILGQVYLSFKQHYFSWQSQCLKTTQNVANFCPIKSDLYGNTI